MGKATLRVRLFAFWLFGLAMAQSLFIACTSEVTADSAQIVFDLADSLKNYPRVTITLFDAKDSSKVLDTVFDGSLPNPKSLPPYKIPEGMGNEFRIQIHGFNAKGLLALETNILVKGGEASPSIKTPPDKLPTWIPPVNSTRLSNLEISVGELNPPFNPEIFSYSVAVPFESAVLTLNATALDSLASIAMNEITMASGIPGPPNSLLVGESEFKLTVNSKGQGLPSIYRLTLNRAPGSEARLDSLKLSMGEITPMFNSDSLAYSVVVDAKVLSLRLQPIAKDKKAKIEIEDQYLDPLLGAAVDLNPTLDTPIQIKVTAIDGSTSKIYSITVKHAKSSDASLTSIFLRDGDNKLVFLLPAFDPNIEKYTAMISTDQMSIKAIGKQSEASISINGKTPSGSIFPAVLDSLITHFPILVLAPDGKTKRVYSVLVTRPSPDALLKSLSFAGAKLDTVFTESRFNYTAAMDTGRPRINLACQLLTNSKSISVMVNGSLNDITMSNPNLSPILTFGLPLTFGQNTISIEVTAQNGINKNFYIVHLTREANAIASLASLTLSNRPIVPIFHTDSLNYKDTVLNSVQTLVLGVKAKDSAASLVLRLFKQVGLDTISPPLTKPIVRIHWDTISVDTTDFSVDKKNIDLATGLNMVEVEVSAENRTVRKSYRIYIFRKLSANSVLSAMSLLTGKISVPITPAFTSTNLAYSAITTGSFITVTPLAFESTSSITVNGFAVNSGVPSPSITLQAGLNTLTVICTAPDNIAKSTYKIQLIK